MVMQTGSFYNPDGSINTDAYSAYLKSFTQSSSPIQQSTLGRVQEVQPSQPEQNLDERLTAMQAAQPAPVSAMEGSMDKNLLQNAIANIQRIGTGLTNIAAHPVETYDALKEYINTPNINPIEDVANLILSSYNTELKDFGTKPAKEIVKQAIEGIYENPIDAAFDFISLGGAKMFTKLFPQLARGSEVEKALAASGSKTASEVNKLDESFAKVQRIAKENNVDLEKVLEAAETGKTVNKAEKEVLKALKEHSKVYDELSSAVSPETHVGAEATAINQKILRERLKTDPSMTYEQVRRETMPYLENLGDLKELYASAKAGDRVAKEVAGAKALYDKGRIFPVTHALANVEKTTATIGELGSAAEGAARAGRFSNRLWGTASYSDIAKQFAKPDEFLSGLAESYLDKGISSELLQGKLGGYMDLVTKGSKSALGRADKDIRYLDRGLLEQGKLADALQNVRKESLVAGDIPIDKYTLNALTRQLGTAGGVMSGTLKDLYQTGKSNLLATGAYLGPNVTTAAAQAIMNSGTGIISDVIEASKTGGKLSKELGAYRRASRETYSKNPVFKLAQQANLKLGGKLWQGADRYLQNRFTEIAAHAEMRKRGILPKDRIAAIEQMDKAKLGEMITDIKRTSLQNTTNIPLPKWAEDLAFAANPFWRWSVTSNLATANMLRRSPILANVVLNDICANIGFDREMQNRLNLGVTLDKPYVTFFEDARTGKTKQVSMEFLPQTSALRVFDAANSVNSPSVVGLSDIINALGGKDRYGRLRKRPDTDLSKFQVYNGKRYRTNPETGAWEEVPFGYGDEILNTAINQLFGAPRLLNETVLPTLGALLSPTGEYYRPYDKALFGSFNPESTMNNPLTSPNIDRPKDVIDVLQKFGGYYESDYYPTREERGVPEVPLNMTRQLFRQHARNQARQSWGGR